MNRKIFEVECIRLGTARAGRMIGFARRMKMMTRRRERGNAGRRRRSYFVRLLRSLVSCLEIEIMRHRLLGIVIGSRATAVAIISHYYCYRSPCPTLPLPFHLSSLFLCLSLSHTHTHFLSLPLPLDRYCDDSWYARWTNGNNSRKFNCRSRFGMRVRRSLIRTWTDPHRLSGDYKILHDFFSWFVQHSVLCSCS